jgi:uncharacterized membrane protein YozB (DUF420 family)
MAEQSAAVIVPAATGRSHRVDRWFYISMAVLMIVFNAVAFGPSIIDPSTRNVPLPFTPLVMAHAIVAAAWLLLFLTQATLVATRRTALHRRVGIVGAVLTLVFIVVGCFTVIEGARRGFDLSGDLAPQGALQDPAFTMGGLLIVLTFAMLAGAGLAYRRRPDVHKRLMLLAMLGGLTNTPVAHLIGHWSLQPWAGIIFPVSLLIFLSLSAIYDRLSQGRIHPVSLWVGLLVFAWSAVFNIAIVPSAAWREFATWLIR